MGKKKSNKKKKISISNYNLRQSTFNKKRKNKNSYKKNKRRKEDNNCICGKCKKCIDKEYYNSKEYNSEDEKYNSEDQGYNSEDQEYNSEDQEYNDEKEDPFKTLFSVIFNEDDIKNNNPKYNLILKKIKNSKIPSPHKENLIKKLKTSNLDDKLYQWFNTILSIPYGKYSNIKNNKNNKNISNYLSNVIETLDKAVYGMQSVKEEILNYVVQTLTSKKNLPRILALQGYPGIGKTKIIRDGISKVLNKPLQCFSMGGIKDSSFFLGFDYTYLGSKQGSLSQSIINSKVMDPIIFFDELDKISSSNEGEEIENLLVHLTDPIQNYDFKDKYLDIPIDLSKVFFIFAFNDISKISPILKDRLHIIKIPPPSINDKIIITIDYIIPSILDNISSITSKDFIIEKDIIKYIINNYTEKEYGIRQLKRCIETIFMKINTLKLLGENVNNIKLSFSPKNKVEFPFKFEKENIDKFLLEFCIDEDNIKLSMYM